MKTVWKLFTPNQVLSKRAIQLVILSQIVILLTIWTFSPFVYLPKPTEVWQAFGELWSQDGLGSELVTSLTLNIEALLLATVLSLILAYSSRLPFMRPVVSLIGKLRFLSLVGLSFFFTIMASSGHELKLYLLMFSVSVFFVTGMADVISGIEKENYDLARTLRMKEWETVWEVVVLGQTDKAFDVLRQNAAIGWMMLTMVEGLSRSEGGIGTLLLDSSKHFNLSKIFAIQLVILVLGLCQDYFLGLLKKWFCPFAALTTVRE